MNIGKKFEKDFSDSIPEYVLVHRLPDSAQAFGNNSGLRFSNKSPFDFLLWDSRRRVLYALEMKSVSGKTISFERSKEDNGVIHFHQIEGLNRYNKYEGVVCGFVINFRAIETTIFICIDSFNKLIELVNKKSVSYNDIIENKIQYIVIPQTIKRTRYTYDVESLLSNSNFIGKEDKE